MIPPIKWRNVKNASATNHMLFIEIEPHLPLATLAQEVAEWQHKAKRWIPAGAAGLALGSFAGWSAVGWFGLVFGLVAMSAAAVIANNLVSGTRLIEYWGRAVDVAAGGDLDMLVEEVRGYGQFRHAVPPATIKAEIEARRRDAEKWFDRNRKALASAYARRPR
jgi:hypothetical protein